MNHPFSEADKQALLARFNSLESVHEKFDFWRNEIGQPYIMFLIATEESDKTSQKDKEYYNHFLEFRIHPKPEEYKAYNLKLIEIYNGHIALFFHWKMPNTLHTMIIAFEKRTVDNIYGRKEFIEREIEKIRPEINARSKESSDRLYKSHQLFKDTFKACYYEGEEVNYSEECHSIFDLIAISDASMYADYMDFLAEELSKANKKTLYKSQEVNLRQQLLLLDYLGVMEQLTHPDIKERINIISLLTNRNILNVRTHLIDYDSLKYSTVFREKLCIREDLLEVQRLLEEQGLKQLAEKVKADIDQLNI